VEPERVVFDSTPTAVVRREMTMDEVPYRIGPMYDAVYSALAGSGARQAGQNIAIYTPTADGRRSVEVGVQVAAPFEGSDELTCSSLPAGPALHHRHVGPYAGIGAAFDELYAWATEQGFATTGVSVEIYGDHDPDQSRLVTDLYAMLID
jgi:effector-binding domain-containing protein